MSRLKATEVEVSVRSQNIAVIGYQPPDTDNKYVRTEEIELTLPLARELLRLLTALIPLAEQAAPLAPLASLDRRTTSA
jgi:hypothetical protein